MVENGADTTLHATCIALQGRAALIRGPSGSGKSDLALRCLAVTRLPGEQEGCRAELVCDDRTVVRAHDGRLMASPHPALAGLIEVRGLGVLSCANAASANVVLLVDLVEATAIDRFPDPLPRETIEGFSLPVLKLAPFENSAAIKLLMALRQVVDETGRLP